MALNPLGVELPNEEDNICIICHDLLNTAPTYTLPECKHQYHTHCIITWFRHRKSSGVSNTLGNYGSTIEVDGRCPHCGDTGINNVTLQDGDYRSSYRFLTRREKELYKINREYGRKKDAPNAIKKEIEKLSDKEKELQEFAKEVKAYKKHIKETPVHYEETKKQLYKNRKKCWALQRSVSTIRKRIASYPIVPLIIPKPIDIN